MSHSWKIEDKSKPGSFRRNGEFYVTRVCRRCGCEREDTRVIRTYTLHGKQTSAAPLCLPTPNTPRA